MLIRQNIGVIPAQEIIRAWTGCWRFVSNGEAGMHSHAGAWERENEKMRNRPKLFPEQAEGPCIRRTEQ